MPVQVDRVKFIDYTGLSKGLELRIGVLSRGEHVLLVDEWVETGAKVTAATTLIERQGGVVTGIAAIHIDLNERTRPLLAQYNCHALEIEE